MPSERGAGMYDFNKWVCEHKCTRRKMIHFRGITSCKYVGGHSLCPARISLNFLTLRTGIYAGFDPENVAHHNTVMVIVSVIVKKIAIPLNHAL